MSFGIYVHVPFCRRKCPYCDFYSAVLREGDTAERYTRAVLRDLMRQAPSLPPVTSLYFGGGTPDLLGDGIARITRAVQDLCTVVPGAEITVECNPESVTSQKLTRFAKAGVNRISMGVQSAVEQERRALGRVHSNEQVLEAVENCRQAGITNISLDLMLGIPHQTRESLSRSLDFLIETRVPHLSLYLLSVEEGTPFARRTPPLPDEDETADMYRQASSFLRKQGYNHYEISNFALPGRESVHNLTYWRDQEYLGIGPAAHSFVNGRRFFNPRDVESFLADTLVPVQDGAGGDFSEKVMLGLRLREGVYIPDLHKKFTNETDRLLRQAQTLIDQGFAVIEKDRLSLTEKGFLLSNSIISILLQERD